MATLEEKYRKLETEYHLMREKQLADAQENDERKRQYDKKIKSEEINKVMLTSEVERLNSEIDLLKREHDRALQKLKIGFESDIKKLKERTRTNENNQELRCKNVEIERLLELLKSADETQKELSQELDALDDENNNLKSKMKNCVVELTQLKEEKVALKAEISALKRCCEEAERAKDELARRLREEKEVLKADKLKLSQEIESMRSNMADLRVTTSKTTTSSSHASTSMGNAIRNKATSSVLATSSLLDDIVSHTPGKVAEKRKSIVTTNPLIQSKSKNLILSEDEDTDEIVAKPIQDEPVKKPRATAAVSRSKSKKTIEDQPQAIETLTSQTASSNQEVVTAKQPALTAKKQAAKRVTKKSAEASVEAASAFDANQEAEMIPVETLGPAEAVNHIQTTQEKPTAFKKKKKSLALDRRVSFAPNLHYSPRTVVDELPAPKPRSVVVKSASTSNEPAPAKAKGKREEPVKVNAPVKRKDDHDEDEDDEQEETAATASKRTTSTRGAARTATIRLITKTVPTKTVPEKPMETKSTQTDDEDEEEEEATTAAAATKAVKVTKQRKTVTKARK